MGKDRRARTFKPPFRIEVLLLDCILCPFFAKCRYTSKHCWLPVSNRCNFRHDTDGDLHVMQVICSKLPFFLLLFRGTSLPAESPKGFPGCQASTWVQYPSGWPGKLDYGIYWFGPNNSWTKAVPGNPGRFYDPSKSVLLYFHGWEGGGGGSIPVCYRQTADYSNLDPRSCSQEIRFVDEWLKSGWNVGFFLLGSVLR